MPGFVAAVIMAKLSSVAAPAAASSVNASAEMLPADFHAPGRIRAAALAAAAAAASPGAVAALATFYSAGWVDPDGSVSVRLTEEERVRIRETRYYDTPTAATPTPGKMLTAKSGAVVGCWTVKKDAQNKTLPPL